MVKAVKICPLIGECDKKVTESFFIHVCQQNFDQCPRYASCKKKLKRPIDWLVEVAVQTDSYGNRLKSIPVRRFRADKNRV